MLSPESPRKNKLLQLSTFCSKKKYHCRNLKHPETREERKTNTYRRSWWRQWDNRKSCGETNFVHIFIPNVHFKQKSEVSAAKKLSFTTASAIISKANPRLLHRWAWATRNNLWKRSWHDTESDPVKWKYRNSQCNFGFPLTLPKATGFKATGVELRWGGARWGVKQSDISLPTMNGLVVLQAYVVLPYCMWPEARKAHLTFTVRYC